MYLLLSLVILLQVGPITLGLCKSAHLVHSAISTRGLVNMLAVAAVEAQQLKSGTNDYSLQACPYNIYY